MESCCKCQKETTKKEMEEKINPVISELNETIKNLRYVISDIAIIKNSFSSISSRSLISQEEHDDRELTRHC